MSKNNCVYCGGEIALKYGNCMHPYKKDHGPFYMYECNRCGSIQTKPLPSKESLSSLYESYRDGLPELHRNITQDDPQNAVYALCIKRLKVISNKKRQDFFTWIDVGAGGGEFASQMSISFPNSRGIAVDQHAQPTILKNCNNVSWIEADINESAFINSIGSFDIVASIAVWEHVSYPDIFIKNLLTLINSNGVGYFVCPNNASFASKVLRRRWPLFTPGEHLSMPTPQGASECIDRAWKKLNHNEQLECQSKSIMLPYTIRYVFRRFGLDFFGKLFPLGVYVPIPLGALETYVKVGRKK